MNSRNKEGRGAAQKRSKVCILLCLIVCLVAHGQLVAAKPKFNIDPTPIPDSQVLKSTFNEAVEKAAPSVVYVYTTKRVQIQRYFAPFFDDPFFRRFFGLPDIPSRPLEREEHGLGSGVIVTEDGYILTNNHVVEGADQIEVKIEEKSYKAKVVGADPATDVAVLKIEANGLPTITMTDSDNLRVGDIVLAIGNPFGVGKTVTMGIVSAVGRSSLHVTRYENFIQTDAAINPGNSGGALVDVKGRLVGINTLIYTRTGGYMGIGFAIPINLAKSVMESILEHGRVIRGYLGVRIQPITEDLAQAFGLSSTEGALIAQVEAGTPAEKAGLKEGDVIIAVNGNPVKDPSELSLRISQMAPNTEVELTIIRDGKKKVIKATLGEYPAEELAQAGEPQSWDLLAGLELRDLTPQLRRQFDIPASVEGALVTDVDPDSTAARAGLRPGDVIMSVNRQRVRNAQEAITAFKQAQGERILLRVWSQGTARYIVITRPQR